MQFVSQGALRRSFAVFLLIMGAFILYQNRAVLTPRRSVAMPAASQLLDGKAQLPRARARAGADGFAGYPGEEDRERASLAEAAFRVYAAAQQSTEPMHDCEP